MQISVIVNSYSKSNYIIDSLRSIFENVTKNVIVLLDNDTSMDFPCPKLVGFPHNHARKSYRNTALGLQKLSEIYPDSDWYCYVEQDILWGSDRFKHNLKMADERNIWMLGNNGRVGNQKIPLVESMLGRNWSSSYYLLGSCLFFNKKFIAKLNEIDFFNRFLFKTSEFENGYMPSYRGRDLSEHLYPTLARHFGGNIGVFASYENGKWHGSSKYFPIRIKPELKSGFENASIMGPVRGNNPIREYYRKKRCLEIPEQLD